MNEKLSSLKEDLNKIFPRNGPVESISTKLRDKRTFEDVKAYVYELRNGSKAQI